MDFNKFEMLILNGKTAEAEHHWDAFGRLNDEDLSRQWNKKLSEVILGC